MSARCHICSSSSHTTDQDGTVLWHKESHEDLERRVMAVHIANATPEDESQKLMSGWAIVSGLLTALVAYGLAGVIVWLWYWLA
jgi:hypothetical protein